MLTSWTVLFRLNIFGLWSVVIDLSIRRLWSMDLNKMLIPCWLAFDSISEWRQAWGVRDFFLLPSSKDPSACMFKNLSKTYYLSSESSVCFASYFKWSSPTSLLIVACLKKIDFAYESTVMLFTGLWMDISDNYSWMSICLTVFLWSDFSASLASLKVNLLKGDSTDYKLEVTKGVFWGLKVSTLKGVSRV